MGRNLFRLLWSIRLQSKLQVLGKESIEAAGQPGSCLRWGTNVLERFWCAPGTEEHALDTGAELQLCPGGEEGAVVWGGAQGQRALPSVGRTGSAACATGSSPALFWNPAAERMRPGMEGDLGEGGQTQQGISPESQGDIAGLCPALSACGWWTRSWEAGL